MATHMAFWELGLDSQVEMFSDTELAVLCYDVTNLASFERVTSHQLSCRGTGLSLLVGLRTDLAANRAVTVAQAHTWAVTHGVKLVEVSAVSGLNLDQLHEHLMHLGSTAFQGSNDAESRKLPQPRPLLPIFMKSLQPAEGSNNQQTQETNSQMGSSSAFQGLDTGGDPNQTFALVDDTATMSYLDTLCNNENKNINEQQTNSGTVRVDQRRRTSVFRAVHDSPWDASTRVGESEHLWESTQRPLSHQWPATARPSTASVAMSRGMLDQSAHKPKVREHTISSRLKSSPPHSARVSSVPRQRHSTSSPNPNDLTGESQLWVSSPRGPRVPQTNWSKHSNSRGSFSPSMQPTQRDNASTPTLLESLGGLLGPEGKLGLEADRQSQTRATLLRIELDIGHGQIEKIDVREGDKPAVLAEGFVQLHGLAAAIIPRLASLIAQRTAGVQAQGHSNKPRHASASPRKSPRHSVPRNLADSNGSVNGSSKHGAHTRSSSVQPFHLETSNRAESSRRGSTPILKLHIQISHARSGTIIVRKGDEPKQLAQAFVDTFKLNPCMVKTIHDKIMEQLRLLQPQPKMKLPKLDFSQLSSQPAPVVTPPATPKPVREILFNLDLDLGPQGAGRLVVRRGDDPAALASRFVSEHRLQPQVQTKLVRLIQDQLSNMAVSTPR
eukprot:TRINITY_DN26409_c0_g1_i2.p1 TRINITY_DN26409_c0_g1~~TRINITY_DN26409_c0_g1_i2.p1  ORF type:complete len:668 (+),score=101.11 TRINITY_DN26409_c0_g1_i2:256-2259(+)